MLSSVLKSKRAIEIDIAIIRTFVHLRHMLSSASFRAAIHFMFQLSPEEDEAFRSQFAISNAGDGGRRYRPYAFTEQGIAMLSSVLRSKRAIAVNIAIKRTFVRLRQLLTTHGEIARPLEDLEWRQNEQSQKIESVFKTIQHLMDGPAVEPKRQIGFPTSQTGLVIGEYGGGKRSSGCPTSFSPCAAY